MNAQMRRLHVRASRLILRAEDAKRKGFPAKARNFFYKAAQTEDNIAKRGKFSSREDRCEILASAAYCYIEAGDRTNAIFCLERLVGMPAMTSGACQHIVDVARKLKPLLPDHE